MNCCDYQCNQGRDCPARATPAATRTATVCDQLGLCKGLTPACPGCHHQAVARQPFAPGVITGGPAKAVSAWTYAKRALLGALVLVSLAFAVGYGVGMWAGV